VSNNWRTFPLSEIADINPRLGKTSLVDEELFAFVPMAAVGASDGTINVTAKRACADVKKGFTPFQSGDVLFAKITPCMENGKMAVVPQLENQFGFGSTEFHVIRPKEAINAKYLYYFVSSQGFRKEAAHHMTGAVGQKRVPTDFLKQSVIPVPPTIEDQKNIVEEIEKQFSRLDEAVAALNRIQANLKRYKAAVLKAAVEGKLTERWRKDHPEVEPAEQLLKRILAERRAKWEAEELAKMKAKGIKPKEDSWKKKYKEPAGPDMANLPELPEGWVWVRLLRIVHQLGDGLHGTPIYTQGTSYYFVNGNNLNNGKIEIKPNTKTVSFEEMLKYKKNLSSDAILVSINGTIGNVAFYNGEEIILSKSACYFNPSEHVSKHYIKKLLESPYFFNYAISNATGSTIKNLSLKSMNELPISLPPLAEQCQIASEVDRCLSVTEELEANIETNLKRAERLRQTILQQAFAGGLG